MVAMEQGRGRHRLGEAISERLKVKSSSFAKTLISPINLSQQSQTKRECDAGANIPKERDRRETKHSERPETLTLRGLFYSTWLDKTLARGSACGKLYGREGWPGELGATGVRDQDDPLLVWRECHELAMAGWDG